MPDLSQDYILSTFRQALTYSHSDQLEIALEGEELALTRFGDSRITQNLRTSDSLIIVRAIKDKKMGVAVANGLDLDSIRGAISAAEDLSAVQPRDEQFISLPGPLPHLQVQGLYQSTLDFNPQKRAEAVGSIVAAASGEKLLASGACRITTETIAVVNSLGVEKYFAGTTAELSITLSGESGNSGYAIGYSRDSDQLDPQALARRAAEKARLSVDPVEIESGTYTVILEPPALGQLLILFSFLGFGCKTFVSQRSFMSGQIGKQIVGANITITEDPYHELIKGVPFDYEGVPRRQVFLIAKGIARGVVWNSYFAGMAGLTSTGHAHPAYKTFSPYPKYMVMEGGDRTVAEMIASVEKGIYITHFWYVNYLNPMRTMVTGTTLDGTFLIENGRISRPVVNLRMAQSVQEALSNCSMLSRERELYPQYSVVMLLPYARIENFTLNREES